MSRTAYQVPACAGPAGAGTGRLSPTVVTSAARSKSIPVTPLEASKDVTGRRLDGDPQDGQGWQHDDPGVDVGLVDAERDSHPRAQQHVADWVDDDVVAADSRQDLEKELPDPELFVQSRRRHPREKERAPRRTGQLRQRGCVDLRLVPETHREGPVVNGGGDVRDRL